MNMARDGKYFRADEFACKCGCGANKTTDDLMRVCDIVRELAGVPLYVNSGTRCPTKNAEVGGVPNSNHMTGTAADLSPRGAIPIRELHRRVLEAYKRGLIPALAGLGFYPNKGFIHVDTSPKAAGRLRRWTEK